MPLDLPAGWASGPTTPAAQTLPNIFLSVPGSPLDACPVGAWSIERELRSALLPGQVRTRSGLSVGSASVKISADALPWTGVEIASRLRTGVPAELYAAFDDGTDPTTRVPLGKWVVDSPSGQLSALGVTVPLIEAQSVGKGTPAFLPASGPVDASWIISQLAAQLGYGTTAIELADITVTPVLPDPGTGSPISCWNAIQACSAAVMGAAWVGLDGVLHFKGRRSMAGISAAVVTAIDVLEQADDLKWTAVGPNDKADRVVVTYGASTDTRLTAAAGSPTTATSNVLTLDLGQWVQDDSDAVNLANYVWGRVKGDSWTVSSVRIVPDWSLDIADVIQVQHGPSGLDARALVVANRWAGEPGSYAQTLDLVWLPWTWHDFDAAWTAAGGTWADFDTAWASRTWADFDIDPTRTEP